MTFATFARWVAIARVAKPWRGLYIQHALYALCALLGLGCLAGAATPAAAHPHMWIDLQSRMVVGDDGRVVAIQQEWLFDDFFSTALIEEVAQHPEGVEAGVHAEIGKILEGLGPFDYFTLVKADDETVPPGMVDSYETSINDNRILMRFTMPVSKPVDPRAQALSYAIFDPTYYIEMFHFDDATVVFEGHEPAGCGVEIQQPNPSAEAIALSQSSDLDANPDSTIGRLFAETVIVTCQ